MTTAAPLFEPSRHEALGGAPWSDERARAAIGAIVEGIVRERLPGSGWPRWPVHALDVEGETPHTGFKSLYLGSAGVLWALAYLQREGAVPPVLDVAAGIEQAATAYLGEPDTGSVVPSYFLGEAGLQLVRWRLTGAADAQERLFASVQSNITNPTNEALWGAPGTMVAAWHLWRATAHEPAGPPQGRVPEGAARRNSSEPARPPEGRTTEGEARRYTSETSWVNLPRWRRAL